MLLGVFGVCLIACHGQLRNLPVDAVEIEKVVMCTNVFSFGSSLLFPKGDP